MEVVGKLHVKGATQEKSATFKVREIVVEVNEEGMNGMVYTNYIAFQLVNNATAAVDPFNVGDAVKVQFSIRGREWTAPDGNVRYLTNLNAFRVEPANAGGYQSAPQANNYSAPAQGGGFNQPAQNNGGFNTPSNAPSFDAPGAQDDDLPF